MAKKISGRNRIPGTITAIKRGGVMAQVTMKGPGGVELVAVITNDAVDDLALKRGKKVEALIKATEIMVMVDE